MTKQLLVKCSVCFHEHVMQGKSPIRHGFSIITSGHGHLGAWHTGPCFGTAYPHFGLSTEGTQVALGQVRGSLVVAQAHLERLEGRPVLQWQPPKHGAWDAKSPPQVDVAPGSQGGLGYRQPPAYDQLLKQRVGEAKTRISMLESSIATYEKAIATWQPAEPREVKKPGQPVHLQATRKTSYGVLTHMACRFSRRPVSVPLTEVEADVTCGRCLKIVAERKQAAQRAEGRVSP